ncbi:MAG: A/G-specific adenine glycosylase [Gammaproteobacteria bacterium]|nr:MAG: A/G-specific adenine glycosylase [Gammaproteobacteria bacterium]
MSTLNKTSDVTPSRAQAFSTRLLSWYACSGRHDLPWKADPTPYRVWVSEVMLQQTQVSTALPYFLRFMEQFPDVQTLANAPEDAVLATWTGLGYYRRARNLWNAARELVANQHGELPDDPIDLERLPGIGRSTAGAIAALAFNRRAAILDGNVKRVLARIYGIDEWPGLRHVETRLWTLAEAHTPTEHAADYTQAIMDLGATICTRRRPRCTECPVVGLCAAHRQDRVADWPAPRPRRVLPERTTHMLILEDRSGRMLLQRRETQGVWGGLWCFPEHSPEDDQLTIARRLSGDEDTEVTVLKTPETLSHQFTHFRLHIRFAHLRLGRSSPIRAATTHLGNPPESLQDGEPAYSHVQPTTAWFAANGVRTVGLAAPVIRHLARHRFIESTEHG